MTFPFVTYFQLVFLLVLGIIVVFRNKLTTQKTNFAELMEDVGGRFNPKTEFVNLDIVGKAADKQRYLFTSHEMSEESSVLEAKPLADACSDPAS